MKRSFGVIQLALSGAALFLLVACGGSGSISANWGNNGDDKNPPESGVGGVIIIRSFGEALTETGSYNGQKFAIKNTSYPLKLWSSRINGAAPVPSIATALDIPQQLDTAGAAGFRSTDIVLIESGVADVESLLEAYLRFSSSRAKADSDYELILKTLLDGTDVNMALTSATAREDIGDAYMNALADRLTDAIGNSMRPQWPRIIVANMPNLYHMPGMRQRLDTLPSPAATQANALLTRWTETFNARLEANLKGFPSSIVFDFYARLDNMLAYPANWGLTNVQNAACSRIPASNIHDCSAEMLPATLPQGTQGGTAWWTQYLFADGRHFTPYGHQLLAGEIMAAMQREGWLQDGTIQ